MENNLGDKLRDTVQRRGKEDEVLSLIEQGADVNYNSPSIVYPFGGTPLHMAAQRGSLNVVKLLVSHGADVTITDMRGARAYHYATCYSYSALNFELIAYLKSIEPKGFHDKNAKIENLKNCGLPNDLIIFLQNENRCIKLSEHLLYPYPKEVNFLTLMETYKTEYQGRQLLLLTTDIDGASFELVWDFEAKCIGYVDVEHEVYNPVCSFDDFMKNPTDVTFKIANGEYAE